MPLVGETARAVFADAQKMLQSDHREKWLSANAVFGLFPANAVGDDIEIYADEARSEKLMSWHNLRQQQERPAGKPHYCLSDFVADAARRTGSAPLPSAPVSASRPSSPSLPPRTTITTRSC
jgi:5-methyltetrahydrofolate--homocysteine methyltransferase